MVLIVTAVVIGILYWFFGTELGCGIRATGSNPCLLYTSMKDVISCEKLRGAANKH